MSSEDQFFNFEAWKNYIASETIYAIQQTDLYRVKVDIQDWIFKAQELGLSTDICFPILMPLVSSTTTLSDLEQALEKVSEVNYRDTIINWLEQLAPISGKNYKNN